MLRVIVSILFFTAFQGIAQIIYSDQGMDFNRPIKDFAVRNTNLDFTIRLYENKQFGQSKKVRLKYQHSYRVHWKNDTTILVALAGKYIDSFYMQHNRFHSFESGPISYTRKGDTLIRMEAYESAKEKIHFLDYLDTKNNLIGTANLYENGKIVDKMEYAYTFTDTLNSERAMFSNRIEYEYNITLSNGLPTKYELNSEYNKPVHQLIYKGEVLDKIYEYRENELVYMIKVEYHPKGLSARKMKVKKHNVV